ncbi:MAG: hypothetical protein ABI629_02545 [bacterium]
MRATIGAVALIAACVSGVAFAKQPGPVVEELGPVVPTPQPSPKAEQHIRMITSFTLGNKPTGESVISFEATDFGVSGKIVDESKYRTIATEQYSLVEPKAQAKELRDRIMLKIRDLERDMLKFVEITGPPRVREPISSGGAERP